MNNLSKLTKKDIQALSDKQLMALVNSAKQNLLQALESPADKYPTAMAKRCLWVLQEQTRRRRNALKDKERKFKEAQALPTEKERTAAIKKLLLDLTDET